MMLLHSSSTPIKFFFFFFNDTATTEIYTLSLHDALPNLHSFTLLNNSTNSDGAYPYAGLILSGTTLYGTAVRGGSSSYGTVFAVHTNGTGFTNLHSFTAPSATSPYTNSDGADPFAGLILSGNTLYGTATYGGSSGYGTVFAINTNGTGVTN